ncbi:GNAT family N-acetyltransferase [Acinetobacter rudis]|uniref:GNAT family N-acetyltransferase n=1 Tax=Acinetobacter rudis TaxID=632955 RepID=A0AAW8JD55_9GAMM|nr:GNAT family N-acetyltransferase [Acinetobacter rudis]MDQ8936872.1 GNAT family N-acetyltransferase [Acinetobacter rudis]MDQ9019106.1 GNAT family N-acetyltransferase [Acinetobacter rudis]
MNIETSRLILRQWRVQDHQPFIEMGLDPQVMRYFPNNLNETQSLKFIATVTSIIQQQGWGFWAVELKATGQFIGFVGLHHQPSQFEFSPCVEIGWRLARAFWQQGYATEAAQAALKYAFETLQLEKVVAFTAKLNSPSEAVMQKIGMHKVDEFNHPKLPMQHPLQLHVLYEIKNPHR